MRRCIYKLLQEIKIVILWHLYTWLSFRKYTLPLPSESLYALVQSHLFFPSSEVINTILNFMFMPPLFFFFLYSFTTRMCTPNALLSFEWFWTSYKWNHAWLFFFFLYLAFPIQNYCITAIHSFMILHVAIIHSGLLL